MHAWDPQQLRREARGRWSEARSRVQAAAVGLEGARDVIAANRKLTVAVDEWEQSRGALERLAQDAGWLSRLAHKRRLRRDDRLRATVQKAISRRKRSSSVVKSRSADLPAHDWLKDAWR